MSKTDKTRPFKIRLGDDLARIAHHDHSNGFCDLPSTLAEELARAGSRRNEYNCFWDFVYTGINVWLRILPPGHFLSQCSAFLPPTCTARTPRRRQRNIALGISMLVPTSRIVTGTKSGNEMTAQLQSERFSCIALIVLPYWSSNTPGETFSSVQQPPRRDQRGPSHRARH